jgi:hypothetical protein
MLLDDFRATQGPVVMGPGVRRDDDVGDPRARDLAARYARGVRAVCAPNTEGAGNAGRLVRPQPRVV